MVARRHALAYGAGRGVYKGWKMISFKLGRKEGGKNGPTMPKAEKGFLPHLTLDQGQK